MAINKVVYGGDTLIDLTSDTVTPPKLKIGAIAHAANGTTIEGELAGVYYGTAEPSSSEIKVWIDPSGTEDSLIAYPVGAIYISATSTSPAELFGGNWLPIEDTFLLTAGQIYTAGNTGGEATHTLNSTEMPAHRHNVEYSTDNGSTYNQASLGRDGTVVAEQYLGTQTGVQSFTNWRARLALTGGGGAHNNMPPYLVVYAWQRIA